MRPLAVAFLALLLPGCAGLVASRPEPADVRPARALAPVVAPAAAPQPEPPPQPPPPAAAADQEGVWLPRGEAARLFGRDQQVGLLERDVASVKEELALEKRKSAALQELVKIERAKAEGRAEIAKIEVERREAWQQRAAEAERKNKFNRAVAGAGVGLAFGTPGGPPGMALGAAVGALFGYFFGD